MYVCKCGRKFEKEGYYKLHEPHCKGLRYCQNPECGKLLVKLEQIKFCSLSCCGKVTVKGRTLSEETKEKIKKTKKQFKKIIKCSNCGKETTNTKYCSIECSRISRLPKDYEKKNYISRKEILWNEQDKKCYNCGFNLYSFINGPYEIHHLDRNSKNRKRENEELLCCNCHTMTDNYRFKGRNHTKKSKELISKNWKPPQTSPCRSAE